MLFAGESFLLFCDHFVYFYYHESLHLNEICFVQLFTSSMIREMYVQ